MSFCELSNKKALVTGGSRGIGKAIAEKLRDGGAEVIISGSNEETLKETARTMNCQYIVADLDDKEQVEKLIEEVGHVDILVNNAGITRDNLFSRIKEDEWNDVLRVNLDAAVQITRGLLPNMISNNYGRIVNISSIVAHMGNVGQTNYITSKAAMTGFTKGLAKEVARKGVTVNCVAPGFIETSMTSGLPEKVMDKLMDMIPSRRFGQPAEIGGAVRFLSSEEAAYITGTTLHVNGAMYV